MSTNAQKFLDAHQTAQQLRAAKAEWDKISEDSRNDKKGFGFNLDDRFTAFCLHVNLSSWVGQYGSSSCHNILSVRSEAAAHDAFVKYLNRHLWEILAEMSDIIDNDQGAARAEYVKSLKEEIARLEPAAAI